MSQLWTRVECLCGGVAAIPENGIFPLCGGCGRRMIAPGPPDGLDLRISLVAEPMGTEEAVRRTGRHETRRRLYSDPALRGELQRRGFPTEAPDWPLVGRPDGHRHATPPWEITA